MRQIEFGVHKKMDVNASKRASKNKNSKVAKPRGQNTQRRIPKSKVSNGRTVKGTDFVKKSQGNNRAKRSNTSANFYDQSSVKKRTIGQNPNLPSVQRPTRQTRDVYKNIGRSDRPREFGIKGQHIRTKQIRQSKGGIINTRSKKRQ